MEIQTEQFTAAVKRELQNSHSRAFLKLMPPVLNMKRDIGLSTFPDIDAAQAYGAAIRQEAMARLPELLEEFEQISQGNAGRHSPRAQGWMDRVKEFFNA